MYQVLQPVQFGRLDLRNRLMRSATTDGTADEAGRVTASSVALFEALAAGGIGFIVAGYAFVSSHGQAVPAQYGIHVDEMTAGLRRLANAAHAGGAKIAAQIVHCGRVSGYLSAKGEVAVAPSVIPWHRPHRAMTEEEIEGIIADFVCATLRAKAAGFDAVQLHGAHGYLMSQFFSPLTNRREDRWGGTPENRRRFHVEIVRRARAALGPDYPLMIKFGIQDDDEGGASFEEGLAALRAMVEAGLDAVEISGGIAGGKLSAVRVSADPLDEVAYYRQRAATVKRVLPIPVAVVGGVRRLETAEDIVNSGDADIIAFSRPLIREPNLIARWQSGDLRRAQCRSCGKCLALIPRGVPIYCADARSG